MCGDYNVVKGDEIVSVRGGRRRALLGDMIMKDVHEHVHHSPPLHKPKAVQAPVYTPKMLTGSSSGLAACRGASCVHRLAAVVRFHKDSDD